VSASYLTHVFLENESEIQEFPVKIAELKDTRNRARVFKCKSIFTDFVTYCHLTPYMR
jgi:hypothetical protein